MVTNCPGGGWAGAGVGVLAACSACLLRKCPASCFQPRCLPCPRLPPHPPPCPQKGTNTKRPVGRAGKIHVARPLPAPLRRATGKERREEGGPESIPRGPGPLPLDGPQASDTGSSCARPKLFLPRGPASPPPPSPPPSPAVPSPSPAHALAAPASVPGVLPASQGFTGPSVLPCISLLTMRRAV